MHCKINLLITGNQQEQGGKEEMKTWECFYLIDVNYLFVFYKSIVICKRKKKNCFILFL